MTMNNVPPEISRALLGKIVDEVFDGGIEDASVIEDIYRVIARELMPATPNDVQSATAVDKCVRSVTYPDFRPQLSALAQSCQQYVEADGSELFPYDALNTALVALEQDARNAAIRYNNAPAEAQS